MSIRFFIISFLLISCYGLHAGSPAGLSEGPLSIICPPINEIEVDCLPISAEAFEDFSSVSNEDKAAFEALGGQIINSCSNVVIRIEELIQFPFVQDCSDTLHLDRIFTIWDGDPNNPTTTNQSCTISYKVSIPNDPNPPSFIEADETIISCAEDIEAAMADFLVNLGYFGGYETCSTLTDNIAKFPPFGYRPANPIEALLSTCNGEASVRVQFALIDECGVELDILANFKVVDNVKPEFINCPTDLVMDISENNIQMRIDSLIMSAEATDNCSMSSITPAYDDTQLDLLSCDPLQEILISFEAEDECGLINDECSSTVSITNSGMINITCPADTLFIECGDPMDSLQVTNWIATTRAIDFKNDVISMNNITNDFNFLSLEETYCNIGFIVTFTAMDLCGRTEKCEARVEINDLTPPTILACPTDTVVNADSPTLVTGVLAWLSQFDAIDQCNPNLTIGHDFDTAELNFNCGTREFDILFTADDECIISDASTCSAKLEIIDNVVSEFISFPNDTMIECMNPIDVASLSAWADRAIGGNNLGNTWEANYLIDVTDPRWTQCGEVVEIVFIFEDLCGQEIIDSAAIQIVDNISPEINCPNDITLVGDFTQLNPEITAWLESATETDNCGIRTVLTDYSENRFDPCSERDTQLVTFIAEDVCGNRSQTCTAQLIVETEKQPILTCPANLNLECGNAKNDSLITVWIESAVGTDFAGGELTISNTYSDQDIDFISCFDTLSVNYSIIDACLFEKNCWSMITIQDTQPPNISCPDLKALNTTDLNIMAAINSWIDELSYDDNDCLEPVLNFQLDVSQLVPCDLTEDIVVNFTVTDLCGLSNNCTGRLSINNSPPQVNCPPSLRLECGDPDNSMLIDQHLLLATATDNNGEPLTTFVEGDLTLISDCTQTIIVMVVAEDNCQVSNDCEVIIDIFDSTAPVFDCPSTLSLLSGDPNKGSKFDFWTSSILVDECNEYTITTDFDTSIFVIDCEEIDYQVEIVIEDECGLKSDCMAMVSVANNVQTTFVNCGSSNSLQIECGDPQNDEFITEWLKTVAATDNLGNEFSLDFIYDDNDPAFQDCSGEVEVIFSLIDFCNSSSTCTSSIFITDMTAPIIDCPQDTSFVLEDMDFDTDVSAWLSTVGGTDNCAAQPTFSDNYSLVSSVTDCRAFDDYTIEFNIEDECGQTDNCEAILRVETTKVPQIICPANELVIECGDPDIENIILAWIDTASGIDADGDPLDPTTPGFSVDQILSAGCSGVFDLTFEIVDDCGIIVNCPSNIILEDTTPPESDCPAELTVNSTDPNGPDQIRTWIDSYSSSDACSATEGRLITAFVAPNVLCNIDMDTELVFVATDDCGLTDTCTTRLMLNVEGPTINCDLDLSIQCGDDTFVTEVESWLASFSAVDNSGNGLSIDNDFVEATFPAQCADSVAVEFKVTDVCGNQSDCIKYIIQVDTIGPIVTNCPPELILQIETPNLDTLVRTWLELYTAEDQCNTAAVSNDYEIVLEEFDCGQEQNVIFSAIDECGNETQNCISTISFENNIPIDIICPEPISVKCNDLDLQQRIAVFLLEYEVNSVDDNWEVTNDLVLESSVMDCNEAFTQEISFEVTNSCGTTADCETFIDFLPSAEIYIPSIFNPSLQGENSRFALRTNIAIDNITSFRIYSRWGDLMYENMDFEPNSDNGWTGRDPRGIRYQGVYTYQIIYTDVFGNDFEHLGTVTLVK